MGRSLYPTRLGCEKLHLVVSRSKAPVVLSMSAFVLAIIAVVLSALSLSRQVAVPTHAGSTSADLVMVPQVVGMQLNAAHDDLLLVGLSMTGSGQCSSTVPVGDVISQEPPGEVQVPRNAVVTVKISSCP